MRILYVEDNPELRETIGMLMEGEGRTVTSCACAEEALVLDAGHPFDVLVTDEPARYVRNRSGPPVAGGTIRCAGWCCAQAMNWQPAGQLGPNVRTLLKPFELEELEQLLGGIHTALASVST